MKVVPLRLPVQKLIDELRQLPRDHTPVGDKEPMCPHEEAKRICQRHIKELILTTLDEDYLFIGSNYSMRHMLQILDFINSLYQDGRICPWGDIYYTLRSFYESTWGKRHPWFTQAHQVRELMAMGLIELDGTEYELLASQPRNHELSSRN